MLQPYFELRDIQPISDRPWIPLREISEIELDPPSEGITRLEQWTGIGTAAVEDAHRVAADKLGWSNGLDVDQHRSGVEKWGYSSADVFRDWQAPLGINLVIDQFVELERLSIWHLHPDLVIALDLVREGDTWFRPEEGWAEVVRLHRTAEEKPQLIEIRSEFLRDYLAARGMALYCSSYHERVMVSAARPALPWVKGELHKESGRDRREGIIKAANYPDPEDHFWTRGAMWRTEWVESGTTSTRVRGDAEPHGVTFALENDGTRVPVSALAGATAWLYFAPSIALALLRHRGGVLRWFSAETGAIGATSSGVHFGLNTLGLVTVFAKDIGRLAPWEQRVWAAHNVSPDGGVSRELFAAQMEVTPATTSAPEKELSSALEELDKAIAAKYARPLLRQNDAVPTLLKRANRFRAAELEGMLELAKDLTRLFAERVDLDAVLAAYGHAKGENKPGSMKALEKLIAHNQTASKAATMTAPLFGIYDLRLADAHLGSSKIDSGLARAKVDQKAPGVVQGRQLIRAFVDTLREIAATLT